MNCKITLFQPLCQIIRTISAFLLSINQKLSDFLPHGHMDMTPHAVAVLWMGREAEKHGSCAEVQDPCLCQSSLLFLAKVSPCERSPVSNPRRNQRCR